MAEHQLPKLNTRVRFPSPAPVRDRASARSLFASGGDGLQNIAVFKEIIALESGSKYNVEDLFPKKGEHKMSEKENKGTLPEEKTEVVSDEKLKDVAGGILFSAENIHRPMPGSKEDKK